MYVGLYLSAFLPNGRLFSKEAAQISSAGWLRHLDKLCQSEKTLRFVTLAHGLSMLGTRDNDSQLKLKGAQAHSMALQEMSTALRDPQRVTGDGILAAIRLFRFYEVSCASREAGQVTHSSQILYGAESSGSDKENPILQIRGYYAHTDGEMALFMNRGWQKEWSEAGMYLLVSGRIVSVCLSPPIFVNRRSMLTSICVVYSRRGTKKAFALQRQRLDVSTLEAQNKVPT